MGWREAEGLGEHGEGLVMGGVEGNGLREGVGGIGRGGIWRG